MKAITDCKFSAHCPLQPTPPHTVSAPIIKAFVPGKNWGWAYTNQICRRFYFLSARGISPPPPLRSHSCRTDLIIESFAHAIIFLPLLLWESASEHCKLHCTNIIGSTNRRSENLPPHITTQLRNTDKITTDTYYY